MKVFIAIFCLFSSISPLKAQEKAKNQKEKLGQYIGTWYSADKIEDTQIGQNPAIKMIVEPKLNGSSLQVEVFEKKNNQWQTLMVELISHDSQTDQIVAAGQNKEGVCFIGKGYFTNDNQWFMNDSNFKNESTLHVDFHFLNNREVVLKGTTLNGSGGWQVKYIKLK
jgi:hypothetical protein